MHNQEAYTAITINKQLHQKGLEQYITCLSFYSLRLRSIVSLGSSLPILKRMAVWSVSYLTGKKQKGCSVDPLGPGRRICPLFSYQHSGGGTFT